MILHFAKINKFLYMNIYLNSEINMIKTKCLLYHLLQKASKFIHLLFYLSSSNYNYFGY